MCFLSSIEMVGVTLSYPVVMGIEMTLGTFLLYLLDRDALNVGPLLGALLCVLGAVALDALAQLRLADNEPRGAPPEGDGLLGTPALSAADRWARSSSSGGRRPRLDLRL